LDWNALTPKPCRKPFGIAGAPMIPAVAMTAFTYRHAVVRLQAQSRLVESCGSRCAIRSLNARVSPRSKSGGSGTCLITPRLRRFKISMQATPLSMSIAAGVNANTSEIRAPLLRNVRQNNRIDSGAKRAALTERCRSAALRYFRLPEGPKRLWLSCGRSRIAAPAETEWPILFQQEIYSQIIANLHTAMQMLHGRFFDSKVML